MTEIVVSLIVIWPLIGLGVYIADLSEGKIEKLQAKLDAEKEENNDPV